MNAIAVILLQVLFLLAVSHFIGLIGLLIVLAITWSMVVFAPAIFKDWGDEHNVK